MDNSSRTNIGDATIASDGYVTIIPDSVTLVPVYNMFNSTIKHTLNDRNETSVGSQLQSAVVNYIELDIHHAVRLYYQAFISLFGIVANMVSLVVTLSKRMRKHSTCLYMSAISGSDAVTLVIAFVWWLGRFVDTTSVWSCKLILFFFYYAIHFSVTLLVAMTTERYIAIRFPFWAHVHLTRRMSIYVIIGVAMAILALDAHNLFTRTMLVDAATERTMCLFSRLATVDMPYGFFLLYVWQWLDASVYSFFPFTMLAIFNVLIIHTVRQGAAQMTSRSDRGSKPTNSRACKSGVEQQITAMLLFVTFAFIALTTPMVVTLILEKSWIPPKEAHGKAIWRLWRTIVSNLMYTNHAINALLYSMSSQRFRRELIRLLPCRCYGELSESSRIASIAASRSFDGNNGSNFTCIDTHM